jgi:hypothetical protein
MDVEAGARVRVQSVAVGASVLGARLDSLRARRAGRPDPRSDAEAEAVDQGIRALLAKAVAAAYGVDPRPRRLTSWWQGSLYEAAYLNLHAARSQIVLLFDEQELRAELPEALARVEAGLQKDDPRRADAQRVATSTERPNPREVSRMVEAGYASSDQMHRRVRSFRNVVIIAATVITVFMVAFTAYVSTHPTAVPLCFQSTAAPTAATTTTSTTASGGAAVQVICPTSEAMLGHGGGPAGRDVLVVGLVGLMGGALAAAVSLRNVRGTSTPYDVSVSLAFLKLPTGALTALAALIAIRGEFIPGLSALDSQEQILAYALVFGYAQQLLTGLVDRQAQSIVAGIAGKDPATSRPSTALAQGLPAPAPASGAEDATDATDTGTDTDSGTDTDTGTETAAQLHPDVEQGAEPATDREPVRVGS